MSTLELSPIGFGLLGFTWRPDVSPDEQAFAAMKEAIARGATFWVAGAFYNQQGHYLDNLRLVKRYFTKYPEDADKVVLSVKSCRDPVTRKLGSSPEEIRRFMDETLDVLEGSVKVSIFQSARIDPNVPVEQTIGTIAEYVKAGKIGGIGLSNVSADVIRAAAKVHPIAAVEVELSLLETYIFEAGIVSTCAELNIPIAAYSPLAMGVLSGKFTSGKDMQTERPIMERLHAENYEHNITILDQIKPFALKKNATVAQIAISWVLHQSERNGNARIIPIPGSTTVERTRENLTPVELTEEEFEQLSVIGKTFKPKGQSFSARMH